MNELGTWGVVTDPYVPPELGPEFTLPSCGCVSSGVGPPDNGAGSNNDVYVDTLTETIYQKQSDVWVVIGTGGSGGGIQVFSGNYGGEMPTLPAALGAGITAGINYDLDPPNKTWKWSGTDWSG